MPNTVTNPISTLLVRSTAIACFAAASCLGLQAQQPSAAPAQPTFNLQASLKAPLTLDSPASSYSSSSEAAASDPTNLFSNDDAYQPPPRRRYGRPRYSDRMHNADGSSKFAVAVGGGLTVPVSNSSNVFTPSYSVEGGVGYNFSKNFGVMVNIGYDHFGLQGNAIYNQAVFYNANQDPSQPPTDFSGLDANAHVWSVMVDPIFNVYQGDTFGFYVMAGGGYFHKAINFTLPQTGYYCDPYYGCYPVTSNQNFDTHTTSGGGINVGGGITFKPSRFASAKLYAETRYMWSNTQLVNDGSPISTLDHASTTYLPITVGIRW